jgi:hypothetical protein
VKVFFSYGHDNNRPLIDRLRADLEAASHSVWLDAHEIQPNDDWRRRIVAGLQTTGWTFAFLSPHAVRPDSVCRDEVAITLGESGWALTPVLVEALPPADFPALPTHVQMIDLSDWRNHGGLSSRTFNAWYAPKLNALAAILSDMFRDNLDERRIASTSNAPERAKHCLTRMLPSPRHFVNRRR